MNLGIIEINWSALMILINVLILYLIMKRFFFEKIHNFMQSRQDAVRGAIGEAEAVNRRADLKMEEYQKRIAKQGKYSSFDISPDSCKTAAFKQHDVGG